MKALLIAAAATLSVSLALAPASAKPPAHPAPQTTQAKKPDASSAHCPPKHHTTAHHGAMHKHWHHHHHWMKAWQPSGGDVYQEQAAPPPPPPRGPMPYDRWIDGYGRAYLAHPSEGAPPPCPCPPNMHGPLPPECKFPVWKGYNGHDGLQNGY